MSATTAYTAEKALERLKDGNLHYLSANRSDGDISLSLRVRTCTEGQSPYAVIITCSDSRVIPECIFSAGLGELFVIRVAGNVIDAHQLGSIEYAVEHLGCRLIVVMGHDHCGAVGAAIDHEPEGFVKSITDEIKCAIGDEKDDYKACCLNALHSVRKIKESLEAAKDDSLKVCGAIYRLEDGRVEFL